MAKLASIRPKDLARALRKIGFYKHNQVGSHAPIPTRQVK